MRLTYFITVTPFMSLAHGCMLNICIDWGEVVIEVGCGWVENWQEKQDTHVCIQGYTAGALCRILNNFMGYEVFIYCLIYW